MTTTYPCRSPAKLNGPNTVTGYRRRTPLWVLVPVTLGGHRKPRKRYHPTQQCGNLHGREQYTHFHSEGRKSTGRTFDVKHHVNRSNRRRVETVEPCPMCSKRPLKRSCRRDTSKLRSVLATKRLVEKPVRRLPISGISPAHRKQSSKPDRRDVHRVEASRPLQKNVQLFFLLQSVVVSISRSWCG